MGGVGGWGSIVGRWGADVYLMMWVLGIGNALALGRERMAWGGLDGGKGRFA